MNSLPPPPSPFASFIHAFCTLLADWTLLHLLGSWRHLLLQGMAVCITLVVFLFPNHPQTHVGFFFDFYFLDCAWARLRRLGAINLFVATQSVIMVVLPSILQYVLGTGHQEFPVESVMDFALQSTIHFTAACLAPYLSSLGSAELGNGLGLVSSSLEQPQLPGTVFVLTGLAVIFFIKTISDIWDTFRHNRWHVKQGVRRELTGILIRIPIRLRALFLSLQVRFQRLICFCASSHLSQYTYNKLDRGHIRLLRLQPRAKSGVIRCSIEPTHLSSACESPHTHISYEAVSHRWKDGWPIYIIITGSCNARITHEEKRLQISPAVYVMLRYLQLATKERTIWVDSICINQEDIDEKAWQIELMRDVYQRASKVIAWLGDGGGHEGGLRYAATLSCLTREMFDEYVKWWWDGSYNRKWYAFLDVLQSEWFGRVWMFQEIACASEIIVQYGNDATSWDTFIRALHNVLNLMGRMEELLYESNSVASRQKGKIAHKGAIDAVQYQILRRKYQGCRNTPVELDLGDLLASSVGCGSTTPKDRICALVGLTNRPHPNYHLKDEEIFINTAIDLLCYSLDPLTLSGIGYFNPDDYPSLFRNRLPTWVPDWISSYEQNHAIDGTHYRAATRKAIEVVRLSDSLLGIRGTFLDTVEYVGPSWPKPMDPLDGDEELLDAITSNVITESNEARVRAHYSYEDVEQCLWRTRILNRTDSSTAVGEHGQPTQEHVALLQNIVPTLRRMVQSNSEGDMSDLYLGQTRTQVVDCLGDISSGIFGRRMCFTHNGLMGVVPPYAQVGDLIYLFWGAATPTIIRRKPGSLHHKIVGASYVHGVMMGERFQSHAPSEVVMLV